MGQIFYQSLNLCEAGKNCEVHAFWSACWNQVIEYLDAKHFIADRFLLNTVWEKTNSDNTIGIIHMHLLISNVKRNKGKVLTYLVIAEGFIYYEVW